MPKFHIILGTACAVSLASLSAQQIAPLGATATVAPEAPAPIAPPITPVADTSAATPVAPIAPPVTAPAASVDTTAATAAPAAGSATSITTINSTTSSRPMNEFQGDDAAQVLRLLARQAKINLVISDKVEAAQPPLKVTMRLEDKSALEAIQIIAESKNLVMTERNGVHYIKTKEEQEAEPTESQFYTFSYATAEKIAPLLTAQLQSKVAPQFDGRTNTIFYREVRSNLDQIKLFLATIDKPTQQVMIEARLVEVNANPKQGYGINWAGVVGGTDPSAAQTIGVGGSQSTRSTTTTAGVATTTTSTSFASTLSNFTQQLTNGGLRALAGQFAILSAPQLSATLRLLNQDSDAEFLANPRVVTANNQQATIKITRNQPVPQLNFNEQTATAVFGGFQDKEFGNTLTVTPSINKDSFVTLAVKPEISNKVADATFTFAGATVTSPVIDKRNLESNVLIKSGDTLAIGGLLQDEITKGRTKVPVLGDIPVIGYAFQERINTRTKRNLLVFVTPTIIKQGYGTGLEDQVSGLHHSGEEFADPNGWRNNAKGAVRIVPTSNRQVAADYPKPGTPVAPEKTAVRYKVSAYDREK